MAEGISRSPSALEPGRVQLRIMRVLWKQGQATARQITEKLSKHQPIAHSTVQTLLRQLEEKGMVTHEAAERVFVFRPLVDQPDVVGHAAHDLLTRMFDGSVAGLVSHLLRRERISPEELDRLRELIEAYNAEETDGAT